MNTRSEKSIAIIFSVMACYFGFLMQASQLARADSRGELVCKVDGSQDYFKVYLSQRTYSSEQFSHYQLIDGLTVLVVNKVTMRFNRLSSLNLLHTSTMDPNQPPDGMQLFEGVCE